MDDLDRLFADYRASLPDPEPSAGFTPTVWKRIEARRSPMLWLRRMTEALVAVSAVAALFIALFAIPRLQSLPVYQASYIDVLANEQSSETLAYAAIERGEEPESEVPTR